MRISGPVIFDSILTTALAIYALAAYQPAKYLVLGISTVCAFGTVRVLRALAQGGSRSVMVAEMAADHTYPPGAGTAIAVADTALAFYGGLWYVALLYIVMELLQQKLRRIEKSARSATA